MSQAAPSPQSLIRLSNNNEVTFQSDAAAGGLWAQRVIKGLVALISSDLLGMAAKTSSFADASLCHGSDSHRVSFHFWGIPLTEATGVAWTRLIQI